MKETMTSGYSMKKSLLIFLMLATAAGSGRGVGFMVTPPRYDLTLAAGHSQTYTITIVNTDSTKTVRLQAQVLDWTMKPNGQLVYSKSGSLERSCSQWIEVNPTEFEVPPSSNQEARFTVTAPESTFGSYWAMLFFESQADTVSQGAIGVLMKARVGAAIYLTIPGTEVRQVELAGFSYRRKGYRDHEFKLQVKNTGNAYFRPKGKLEIKDSKGIVAATIETSDTVILPGMQRDLILPLNKELPPGRYTSVINLDCGTPELIQGETAFEVVK
jgi:hypothetical protein